MKIGAYSPRTGHLLSEDITGINFGNVHKGEHSVLPILIRPERDAEVISGLEMYLQNNGGFDQTEYGYFVFSDFVPVESWDSHTSGDTGVYFISDHFVEVSNPPDTSDGIQINIDGNGHGDFVWLDVNPSLLETGGTSSINYRFIFEYS